MLSSGISPETNVDEAVLDISTQEVATGASIARIWPQVTFFRKFTVQLRETRIRDENEKNRPKTNSTLFGWIQKFEA